MNKNKKMLKIAYELLEKVIDILNIKYLLKIKYLFH